jgi:hypothetical protein
LSIHSAVLSGDETQPGLRVARAPLPVPVKYCSMSDWVLISGLGRTKTFEMLADGRLKSVKIDGKRLIDLPHGLAFLDGLPAVPLTTGASKRRRVVERAAATRSSAHNK